MIEPVAEGGSGGVCETRGGLGVVHDAHLDAGGARVMARIRVRMATSEKSSPGYRVTEVARHPGGTKGVAGPSGMKPYASPFTIRRNGHTHKVTV